jgi:hypothetical protein
MSWTNELDIGDALDEVIKNQRTGNDFILDPLRFEDFKKPEIKNLFIKEAISDLATYNAQKLLFIDYPKANFILRPCARPLLKDLVVYQGVVKYIGSKIYRKIPKDISYSFNKFKDKFSKDKKRHIDHWLAFEERTVQLCKSYDYLLTSDIASFFEHICHDVLKERLLLLNTSDSYSNAVNFLIDKLLTRWSQTENIKNFSLPQGPDASRILADIYFYPVDKKMRENRKVIYFRYMDDIRLFAKNKHDLKLALIDLVKELRELKLNLNAKKTKIYETKDKESLKNVIDSKKSILNLIDNAFKSKQQSDINLVYDSLFEIYELAKDNSATFNERYMNFFISHAIDLMKFGMVEKVVVKDICIDFLNMLENRPHMTSKFCWFFQAAAQYDANNRVVILKKAIEFLWDKKKNLYEWQELMIFDTVRQLLRKGDTKFVRQIRKTKPKHYLTECQRRLILGREGETDDIEQIIDDIKTLPLNDEQKRNAAVAIQGLHRSHKEKIYDAYIDKSYTKKFVQSLKGKYYGFTYNLQRDKVEEAVDAYPF